MASLVSGLILVVVTVLVIFLLKKYIEWRKYVNRINLIPGPKTSWPFGTILPFLFSRQEDYLDVFNTMTDDYLNDQGTSTNTSLMRIWAINVPFVFCNKASSAEILLKSTSEIQKPDEYTIIQRLMGKGLITSTGSKWYSHRKLIEHCFHFKVLEKYMPVFNDQCHILVDQLALEENKGSFDICPYISRCTLDIICDSAMCTKINAQTQANSQYVHAIDILSEIVFKNAIYVWRRIPAIFIFFPDKWRGEHYLKVFKDFSTQVLHDRMKERARQVTAPTVGKSDYGRKKRTAFLETLLDAKTNHEGFLTDEEIMDEVNTFITAGYETISSGLVSAIMNLALHPNVQEKAYNELESIFGKSDRPVEMADLPRMKYLAAIIKEALRLHPPVPIFARKLKEDLIVDGFTIPQGTAVGINVRAVHRDPMIYKNPDDFEPSRFLKENCDGNRHPFSFLAFSAGPRNCIGQKFAEMEEKVVLTYILRNFKISGTWTAKDAKMSMAIVSKPTNGLRVTLTKRDR